MLYVGYAGEMLLLPPHKNKITTEGYRYEVISITNINDLVRIHPDLDVLMYEDITDGPSLYASDIENNIEVYKIQGPDGQFIYVPGYAIDPLVAGNGVNYQELAIVVNIGPQELNKTFSSLRDDIAELVKLRIGVDPVSIEMPISVVTPVSPQDHIDIKTVREANISHKDIRDYHVLLDKYNAAQAELQRYKTFITEFNNANQ